MAPGIICHSRRKTSDFGVSEVLRFKKRPLDMHLGLVRIRDAMAGFSHGGVGPAPLPGPLLLRRPRRSRAVSEAKPVGGLAAFFVCEAIRISRSHEAQSTSAAETACIANLTELREQLRGGYDSDTGFVHTDKSVRSTL